MPTIATYNLYLGADLTPVFDARSPDELRQLARLVHRQLLGTDFPARAQAIARLLVREEVDVVGLQEVAQWTRAVSDVGASPPEPEVWCDFLTELLAELERSGAAYDPHAVTANFRGSAAISDEETMAVLGFNAILVRRGSAVTVVGSATGEYTARLDIATGMPDLVLTVARSWGWVDAVVDGVEVRFVNTHTEAYDDATRDAQRDELLREVGDPGTPVVVVGDLNAPPGRVGMPESFQDAWEVGGDGGPGYTCGQAADLANRESLLRPGDRTRGSNLWPSDHACVICELRLPS